MGRREHACARTEAGARLAHFIRAGHAQHPDARHVLIAHSHGGNVALYAMRDPAARAAVTGIVTLGTPFLQARPRDPHRHADVMAWLILTVAVLGPFAVLDALTLAQVAFGWLIAGVFLIVKTAPILTRWVIDTATAEQAAIVSEHQPPDIDPSKLLILCTRGDEARWWLRTWDAVAKVPIVIGFVLLSVVELASRSNLPVLVDGLARSTLDRGLDEIRVFGFDGWAITVGAPVLCVIWGVVAFGSGLLRWPGYWREPLLVNVLVDIRTDRVPTAADGCSHTAYIFTPPSARSLRHTAICEEPGVVGAIVDWVGAKGARGAMGATYDLALGA